MFKGRYFATLNFREFVSTESINCSRQFVVLVTIFSLFFSNREKRE